MRIHSLWSGVKTILIAMAIYVLVGLTFALTRATFFQGQIALHAGEQPSFLHARLESAGLQLLFALVLLHLIGRGRWPFNKTRTARPDTVATARGPLGLCWAVTLLTALLMPLSWWWAAGTQGVMLAPLAWRWSLLPASLFIAFAFAFAEEVTARVMMFEVLRRRGISVLPATLIQAGIFMLAHGGWLVSEVRDFAWYFSGGVLFGYIYIRSGSVWISTLLHTALNVLIAQVQAEPRWFGNAGRIEVRGDWEPVYLAMMLMLCAFAAWDLAGRPHPRDLASAAKRRLQRAWSRPVPASPT